MRLVEALPIHRDTAEMIRETGDGRFVDIDLTETAWNAFFYCCRTTNIRPGDLAVSSVFYPKSGFTAAVVFGCSQSVKEEIAERMSRLENSTSHPLVIMGMIAEIELKRQDDMVGSHVADLLQRMADLTNYEQISTTSKVRKDHYSVASWIGITSLRNSLQTWQVQISRMIEHLDHLQVMFEADFSRLHNDNSSVTVGQGWQRHGAKTGRRMKRRLREIIHEYDKYIQHCNMSIEGMSLATQMSWNQISYQDTQTNIRIASDAKQDSSHMKIIATLTMVFLPATFVSSVFSMSFFDWDPPEGKQIVSHYAWIYPVIVAAITVVVLGVWYPFTKRVKSKHGYVLPSV
ncbi:hypothetical protein GE09DRAFT_1097788 [Coniochaeta sp. 2T2.1]|nr:hypothetical protein GE09DRAFT_1097788 [Coniochaeta sp. 2T2.1]